MEQQQTHVEGGGRDVVLLPAMPSLGPLYARAAGGSAVGAGTRTLRMAWSRVIGGMPLPGPGRRPARGSSSGSRRPLELPAVDVVVADVPIEDQAHRAFCRAVEAPVRTRPDGGVEAFSGYLHALSFPAAMALLTREDFPLPLLGLVHLSNTVVHELPLLVGEHVGVTVRAQNLRPHRSGTQFDVVAELRTEDTSEPAWTGTSTYLARGIRLPEAQTAQSAGSAQAPAADRSRPEFQAPLPTARWQLGADTGRRYAAVSGDVNPIHLSAVSARALGMKGAIAHGMYTASRALAMIDAPVPLRWSVEFGAPLLLPSSPAVAVERDGRGERLGAAEAVVWDARRQRPHATLRVRRLDEHPRRRHIAY